MFIKIILGLVLFIVVAALGTNTGIGEGFFGFKAKGKAADMVEFTRDVGVVMQSYKADDPSNLSAVKNLELGNGAIVESSATDGDNLVVYSDLVSELSKDGLLKGDGSYEIGGFAHGIIGPAGDEDIVLVNSSAEISNEICDKLNEVMGVQEVDIENMTGDLTGVEATDAGDVEFTGTSAVQTAATAVNPLYDVTDGDFEGYCIKDDSGAAQNTFVYFVQKL